MDFFVNCAIKCLGTCESLVCRNFLCRCTTEFNRASLLHGHRRLRFPPTVPGAYLRVGQSEETAGANSALKVSENRGRSSRCDHFGPISGPMSEDAGDTTLKKLLRTGNNATDSRNASVSTKKHKRRTSDD